MWRPATLAVESLISWVVNRVLIGEIKGTPDTEAVEAFFRDFPAESPLDFFREIPPQPLPNQWLWEHNKHRESHGNFRYPSDTTLGDSCNDMVQGKVLFHPDRQRGPAMILVHGWITPDHTQSMRIARELQRVGFSTFMLELPFHMRRTPKGAFSGARLLNPDLRVFFYALRQAVSDLRKLIRGLHAQGYSQIHLCGISLGAYISTVTSSFPEIGQDLSSLSVIMPLVDIGYTFSNSAMIASGRRLLERNNIPNTQLNQYFEPFKLTNFQPQLPTERLLIINARDDQVAYSHKVYELWNAWNRPRLFEEPHGHVSMIFAKEPFRRLAAHLGRRNALHVLTERSSQHPIPQWPAHI